MRARRLAPLLALPLVVAAARALLAEDPKQVVPAPAAWDAQTAALFSARGVGVPRTVMPAETKAPLDLAWIKEALGFATPLSEAEVARLSPQAAAEPTADAAPEGRGGGVERRAAGAPPGAPPPAPTGAPRPARARDEEAPSTEAASKAAEEKDGGDASAPKPVLSRLQTTARVGKVLVQNAQGGYDAIEPRAMRVTAIVDGPRARVVVDLVFRNPHDRRLEGTFHYPLPDGASPAGFGMFPLAPRLKDDVSGAAMLLPPVDLAAVAQSPQELARSAPQVWAPLGGEVHVDDWRPLQQARVVEQVRARQVYEEVVRQDVDPALLEWTGANTFKARVFPLEPRALKRVVIAYEQPLLLDGGLLRWVLPLPGEKGLGAVPVDVLLGPGLALAPLPAEPGATDLRTPEQLGQQGGRRHLRFTAPAGFAGAVDLVLSAKDARRMAIAGPTPELGGRAFYARVAPDVPVVESGRPTGRALFLVDTSLSEEGLRRSLAGELLLAVLEEDPTITEYAVLLFDVRARWLHDVGWRRNTAEARAETAGELQQVFLEGATNLSAALEELERQRMFIETAGEGSGVPGPATRFLLSDGLVTWGQDKVEALLAKHREALKGRWIAYRIGDAPVNRDLYDALARETAGRTVNVLSADQVRAAARAHRSAPVVLKGVSVGGARVKDLVVAGDPRLVFPGQELEVAGRLLDERERGAVTLGVDLEVDGQLRRETVVLNELESPLAPRAWAELWTRRLLALDDERLHRMVVALSQTYSLANEAASLLILETEAEWVRFDLKKEQVDLTDLERLRAAEEDQRRDRLLGVALDDVPPAGRDLVRLLRAHAAPATQPALPLLDRPLAGGEQRLAAEVAYRAGRGKDPRDVKVYDAVARARALAGDTFGAIRALSSLVELMPREAESNRLVGYACLALGQYGPAAELFERVRLNRPFEPQSYLEEALALEALGRWGDAARDYEILLARRFPRHDAECKTTGAYHYARMLAGRLRDGSLDDAGKAAAQARVDALKKQLSDPLEKRALQLTIHWNTDSTDIDLWVVEPEGEKCFYSNRDTKAGGKLFWDTTTGYGPELYRRLQAGRGTYDVLIHYYGNNSARLGVPTAVLFVRDRDCYGPEDAFTRRFQLRLLPESQAVLRLKQETF